MTRKPLTPPFKAATGSRLSDALGDKGREATRLGRKPRAIERPTARVSGEISRRTTGLLRRAPRPERPRRQADRSPDLGRSESDAASWRRDGHGADRGDPGGLAGEEGRVHGGGPDRFGRRPARHRSASSFPICCENEREGNRRRSAAQSRRDTTKLSRSR